MWGLVDDIVVGERLMLPARSLREQRIESIHRCRQIEFKGGPSETVAAGQPRRIARLAIEREHKTMVQFIEAPGKTGAPQCRLQRGLYQSPQRHMRFGKRYDDVPARGGVSAGLPVEGGVPAAGQRTNGMDDADAAGHERTRLAQRHPLGLAQPARGTVRECDAPPKADRRAGRGGIDPFYIIGQQEDFRRRSRYPQGATRGTSLLAPKRRKMPD